MQFFKRWVNSIYGVLFAVAMLIAAAFEWYRALGQGGQIVYSDIYETHGLARLPLKDRFWRWFQDQLGATVYGDDWTKVRAGRRVAPNVFGSKPRIIIWDFASLPAGNIGDVLVCGKLYKGDKVVQGREFHSALSSGAGAATNSIGTYTIKADGLSLNAVNDVDGFLAATDMDAAGQNDIASLQGGTQGVGVGPLLVPTVDLLICYTNSVEANATAGRVSGWLLVARD